MKKPVDVIGIGAINFDYMFQCKRNPKSFLSLDKGSDSSTEDFWPLERVEENITQLNENNYTICSTQLGGSALLALRALNIVCPDLNIGYVGVCGEYDEFDRLHKKTIDIDHELSSFISNQEWLFHTDKMNECPEKHIGKASCTVYKGSRNGIGIFPGANNLLKDFIEEKNKTEPFVDYLSQAKWIHVSSLADFDAWTYIMEFVLQAKSNNRFLKISIDPGSKYTEVFKKEMQKYLREADYIFLSPSEKINLSGLSINDNDQNDTALMDYLGRRPIVLVFKYKDRHVLMDCSKGIPFTYSHRPLPLIKIVNDTGAGDFFAGAFIGALLSERLIAHQPAPIEIGNIVSKARMTHNDINDALEEADKELKIYFEQKYKRGISNKMQKTMLIFDKTEKIAVGFAVSLITGILTGIISTLIVQYILR